MRCGKSFAVIMIVIVGLFSARLQGQPLAQGKSMFLGAGTSSPVTLSRTTSGMPCTSEAITGSSIALASTAATPKPSHVDGIAKMSNDCRTPGTSACATRRCVPSTPPSGELTNEDPRHRDLL